MFRSRFQEFEADSKKLCDGETETLKEVKNIWLAKEEDVFTDA